MRRIAILLSALVAFCFLTGSVALGATHAPARVSCTSTGGVTDGGKVGPPGSAYAYWTALPEPEPRCEEQLRVEVYSPTDAMAASGWLRSTTANIDRKTAANVPGGAKLSRARMEVQFNNDPGSRECRTFFPSVGNWHSCTN